jgi:hypothetical protein
MAKTRRQKLEQKAKEEEEEVAPEEEEEEDENVQEGADDDDDGSSKEDSSDEEEEEEEEGNDVSALFRGSAGADDDEDSDSDDEGAKETAVATLSTKTGPEHCNFDLRNMTAMNVHQVPASVLYQTKKRQGEDSISIPLDQGHKLQVNEDFLLERASAGCAQLVAAIWQLPTETSDAGPLATLPGYNEIPIPRSMVGCCFLFIVPGIQFHLLTSLYVSLHHTTTAATATKTRD